MDENDLIKTVEKVCRSKCETNTIEVKSANKGTPQRLYDTLSSFSNQDEGGIIIFGIDEKSGFKITGVYDPKDLTRRVSEQCSQMVPPVRANISTLEVNGKHIVAAEIPGADFADRPVFYSGSGRIKGSFTRVGDSDEHMSEYEVYSIDAYKRRIKEDCRIVEGSSINDLDPDKLSLLVHKAKANRPQFSKLSDDNILEQLGIIKNNIPTVTGLLTTGKYPQGLIPQYSITAVVIPGYNMGETGETKERFIANKRFCGTIDEMLDEAMLFVGRNINVKTIIDGGRRTDIEEYPLNAVREAVLNAIMHRDYSFRTEGAPIQILMFYDRMEIISPGGLFGRLTVEGLGKGRPDTRNSCLASMLEILGLAENRFSGIPTIKREFTQAALPDPQFKDTRSDFIVTFYNGRKDQLYVSEDKQVYVVNSSRRLHNIWQGSDEDRLLNFCKTPRSRGDIAEFFGNTQYYIVKTYIAPLVEKGLLQLTLPQAPKSKKQRYVAIN
jgi:ATP-dependent DNA helicase RecG